MVDDGRAGWTGHDAFVSPNCTRVRCVAYFFAKILVYDTPAAVEALVVLIER